MGLENLTQDPSLSEERRKSSKPLMEKRRRARINQSLNELKSLILEAMKKDTSCYSKLEKADILEMTVRHLRNLRSQKTGCSIAAPDAGSVAKYRAGFNECATEISRYLITLDGIDMQLRARLLSHMASCCNTVKTVTHTSERSIQPQPSFQSPSLPTLQSPMLAAKPAESVTANIQSPANTILSTNGQYQIVPGTLANGKIAAVIVQSQNPVAMVSTPQFIPIFNKPTADFQPLHGFQIANNALRQEADSLWRPW